MSKYHPLFLDLKARKEDEWNPSFQQVEAILGFALPRSARKYPAWWSNNKQRSRHSKAWLSAGWRTENLSLTAETITFNRHSWDARRRRARSGTRPSTPSNATMRRYIKGYLFERVEAIEPLRGDDAEIIEEMPQSRYRNRNGLSLNNYGHGPFCRFRVARGWRESGVYIIASGDTTVYVGECQNLEERYNSNGYGGISPRNCFRGGQETNCRINASILQAVTGGDEFALWFHLVEGGKADRVEIETRLKVALNPAWNR